jgi:hypothetical protein
MAFAMASIRGAPRSDFANMCNLGVGIARIDSDNRVDHFTWSSRARRMRISPGTNGSNPFPSSSQSSEPSVPLLAAPLPTALADPIGSAAPFFKRPPGSGTVPSHTRRLRMPDCNAAWRRKHRPQSGSARLRAKPARQTSTASRDRPIASVGLAQLPDTRMSTSAR